MTWTRTARCMLGVSALAALAACTTTSLREAPIVDRSERRAAPPAAEATAPAGAGAREAPDGNYLVQRGDTLFSIALAFGQDYRDLARWNNLDDPAKLQVGQTLRVAPPTDAAGAATVAAVPVAPIAAPEVRSLDTPLPAVGGPTPPAPVSAAPPAAAAAAAPPAVTSAPAPPAPSPVLPAAIDSGLSWSWPAAGKVVDAFDESRNKGIGIAGKEGEPVLAAGDGQVVYKGNALRGYGNLVIIKHSDDFVSAYAHNRQILVEHGDSVKRGQRIAEMGKSDADMPKLHFEIRRQGKPVDPLKLLPAR